MRRPLDRAVEPPPTEASHPRVSAPSVRAPTGPPLPDVLPMLARAGALPRDAGAYACELKWDGVRTLAHLWEGKARLRSRTGLDVTSVYPEVARLAAAVDGPAVLDGEIVAFDEAGRPSFQLLQSRLGVSSRAMAERKAQETPVVYVVFDVLHLGGVDTMSLPYNERRALLEETGVEGVSWTTPRAWSSPSAALLEAARSQGMEGIIAKRLDSPYVPGRRSGAWIKVKLTRRQELVVGGWSPGAGARRGGIGALLLGYYDAEGRLRYAGSVGTGFTQRFLDELKRALEPRRRTSSPFSDSVDKRGAVFVEPELVADIEFTEWTQEGKLRHPSFQGMRFDKDPRRVVREETG